MEQVTFRTGTPVLLLWQDSAYTKGWVVDPTFKGEVCTVNTLGYVVDNNPACLTVSCSMATDKGFINPLSVPWSAIVTIEEANL